MDLNGRHVVITGPTAGIGRSSALALAASGAKLTLLCRSREKGEALVKEITDAGGARPDLVIMDMAELASVRQAAQECLALGEPIDILLNNAGVINTTRRITMDGFEETLAVNHFAPFLLTGLLLPNMLDNPGARIVNVASDAHSFVKGLGLDDMQAEKGYKTFREYGRSKGANILFTRSLARRLEGRKITVNCLHPGAVATSLGKQNEGISAKFLPALLKLFFRSPDRGSETSLYLCSSDEVSDISGGYFANCKQLQPKRWVQDDDTAAKLWEYSEKSVGFSYPV